MKSNDSNGTIDLAIADVRYVKDLYPRLRPIDDVIEQYRDAVDDLPPIVVARDGVLVDGYHRWQAHVREERETIRAENLGNLSDAEIFNESIRRNASHGRQLSQADKRSLAGRLWRSFEHLGDARQAELVDLLAVSERTVRDWTRDARKEETDALKDKAWDLWLDCLTEREIAAEVLGDAEKRKTINNWLGNFGRSAEFTQAPESRQHFDVWQFHKADDSAGAQSYFGALPPQVLENLLWLYTEPGDVVVDLFAGSGTTIEVAKSMGRRVWASDIRGDHYSPHLPIHKHDATTGWPAEAPNKAKLVVLDPPYWQQAKGRYSDEPNEMAEMDYLSFTQHWMHIMRYVKDHLTEDGHLAFIVSPTQMDGDQVIDHAFHMANDGALAGMGEKRRIIVMYQTQQATGQQVEWARDNKRLLKLYRDLVVMQ